MFICLSLSERGKPAGYNVMLPLSLIQSIVDQSTGGSLVAMSNGDHYSVCEHVRDISKLLPTKSQTV